jgi:hypothetical protein
MNKSVNSINYNIRSVVRAVPLLKTYYPLGIKSTPKRTHYRYLLYFLL